MSNNSRVAPRPAHARAGFRSTHSTIILDALRAGVILAADTPPENPEDSLRTRVAACSELLSCGYLVSVRALAKVDTETLTKTVLAAQSLAGSDATWTPLFPNFPETTPASLASANSLSATVATYIGTGRVVADRDRPVIAEMLAEATPLTVTPTGAYLAQRMASLLATPVGLSPDDATVMSELAIDSAASDPDAALARLAEFTNGENRASYAHTLSQVGLNAFPTLAESAKTPDDLLRAFLAVYTVPSADIHREAWVAARLNAVNSAAYSVKALPVPRSARRLLTRRLGEITDGFRADALVSRRDLWRRAIQACHPYSLNPSDEARRALDIITGNIEYRTMNSIVEAAMASGDVDTVRELLATHRPGQLLRRLVALAKLADDEAFARLVESVREVTVRIPLTTSLSTYDGVLASAVERPRLTTSLHGGPRLVSVETDTLAEDRILALTEAIQAGITVRLAAAPAPTGVVGVAEQGPIPLIRRDTASSGKNLVRGRTYTPEGTGDTLRFMCHWYNTDRADVDLDLGVTALDSDFNPVASCTWNSYSRGGALTYSGDETSAPRPTGATEFIDVNLDALKSELPDARYFVGSVYNYTGQPLKDVEHLVGAAVVDRDLALFEPVKVTTAGTSLSGGTVFIPMVYDLTTGQFTWIDLDTGLDRTGMSVANDPALAQTIKSEMSRPRLMDGELASWYAKAHGAAVDQDEAPDDGLIDFLIGC